MILNKLGLDEPGMSCVTEGIAELLEIRLCINFAICFVSTPLTAIGAFAASPGPPWWNYVMTE